MPKKVWTKELIIAELKRVRKDGPKIDTRIDAAAKKHFGSLRKALEVAGLPCGSPPRPHRTWTKESTLQAIVKRQSEGKNLGATHRQDPTLYSASKRFFGTWRAARRASGFPARVSEYYTKDDVLLKIVELYEKELPLAFASHNDEKLRRSAKKYFGGWRKALESLGLANETRRKWNKQAIIDAIHHRRASSLLLTTTHLEDKGLFSAAVNHFGNWQDALLAAGIETKKRERWTDARIIERLRQIYTSQCRNLGKEDNNLRGAALRRYGSIEKALKAAGIKPPRILWTKTRVIEAIQSQYSAQGSSSIEGFGDEALAQAAAKRFGSWAEAVEAAGLIDRIPVKKPSYRWTKEEVLRGIQEWQAGKKPSEGVKKPSRVLQLGARRHFGGWRKAVEAVGLQCSRRQWSRKVITQEIRQRLHSGESLSSSAPVNINLAAAAMRHFGSWTAALKAARVPADRKTRKPR